MTPDTLRRAATLIRERAEKATPGAWAIDTTPGFEHHVRTGGTACAVPSTGEPIADAALDADATHIAALHPAVALLLATWLEHEADRAEHQPWTDDVTEQALAFATAYLGEEME